MVKLTDDGLKGMIKRVTSGDFTAKKASRIYGITECRAQQLTKMYRDTWEISKLNSHSRPKTYLSDEQKVIIGKVWEEMRPGARLFFYVLKRRGYKIPHTKIHQCLRATGKTTPNSMEQKKRKRCRYERGHSGSLVLGNWHRAIKMRPFAMIWLGDVSRKALARGDFESATHVESIETFKEVQNKAHEFNVQIRGGGNTDRDTRFYSNKNLGTSAFEHYLKKRESGIFHQEKGFHRPKAS